MLPPRRELPFPKTSSAKKGKKRPAKNEANSADSGLNKSGSSLSLPDFRHLKNPMSDAASNMESASHVSGKSAATVPATTKKRLAAYKTTKSSVPKKQPAKAPSNRASKAEQEEDIMPSFEILLEESQEVSPQQPEAAATIDTQALLSRAEATRPHQSIELPTMYENQGSQSEDSAPNSQMRKCLTCRVRKGKVYLACLDRPVCLLLTISSVTEAAPATGVLILQRNVHTKLTRLQRHRFRFPHPNQRTLQRDRQSRVEKQTCQRAQPPKKAPLSQKPQRAIF